MLKYFLLFILILGQLSLFSGINTNKSNFSTILPISEKGQIYTVTAYCACEKCCGKWSKYNKTANGQTPKQGITCAAPRNIKFNTRLNIQSLGIRVVQDRLAKKYDNRIDIYFSNHKEALKFGKKEIKGRDN